MRDKFAFQLFPFKSQFQNLRTQTPINLHTNITSIQRNRPNQPLFEALNITELAISVTGGERFPFSDSVGANKVEIIKHRNHGNRANEDQNRAKNPEEHRQGSVEEAVADGVENKAFVEEIGDVIGGDSGGAGRNVDQNIGLIYESDGEGMAEEGEEE